MLAGDPHSGPFEHDIVPCWHGLPGGEHVALGVQATHDPWPSHTPLATPLVIQDAPAAAGTPWSLQVIMPPAQEVTWPV
jgi:hypothetical protein